MTRCYSAVVLSTEDVFSTINRSVISGFKERARHVPFWLMYRVSVATSHARYLYRHSQD